MSKNGKGFEKFLREQTGSNVGPSGRGIMGQTKASKLGFTDKPEYIGSQFFTNRPEPGTKEAEAYAAGEKLLGAIQANAPESEIESTAREARLSNMRVDLGKQAERISPAYWVTQADFQQAFNRPYNAMSKEDQRDFFQLVQNAPGATRRTDVGGADVGAVIPSTVRPKSLPKFQDIDGVKVPESAFTTTQRITSRSAPAPEPAPAPESTLTPVVLPYSERQPNPLEDPTNLLKFVQQYATETLTAAQKAALGMEGEYRRDLPYARRAAGLEGSPLPPPPPPELLRALEPENKKANEIPELLRAPAKGPTRREKIEATGKKQRESMEARGIAVPGFDVTEKGFGQFNPVEPPLAPAPESLSDLELARMKRDAKESEPSGFSQVMSLAQGVGQFAKNLDQAAGKKVREAGQKISDIAKRFRTQREENFNKNLERLSGKGISPNFDTTEKGFGQYEGPPLTEPGGGKWEWDEELGTWSYNLGELPPTKLGPETELDISKAVMPSEPKQAFAGVDVEGPPKSDAELSKMMRDAREASKKAKPSGPRGQSLQPVKPGEDYYIFDQTTQDWILVKGGKPTQAKSGPAQQPSFSNVASRTNAPTPERIANAISANQQKAFSQPSPITQEIASRMLSVQTPGQVSTQLSGKPLTTQDRDRFKFDSAVPASVAASMNRVSPVRTPLGQEPLTQTEKPIAGGKKGEREMASFTKGMTDSEVNTEFEKLFGKEQRNLPTEVKKDMIERFRLAELMQQGGGIMGMNPMYEMEIDPDTGELKLNPKKKD